MKKILLLSISFLSLSSLFAQLQSTAQLKPISNSKATIIKANPSSNHQKGNEFFCEDFANGYAGNNPFGAWTVFDDAALGDVWEVGDASLSNGQYSNEPGLASTTAANGYALFDADGYNTENNLYAGGLPPGITGYLTSPEMNMTDLNSVVVNWEQYFRYCCYDFSPLTLQVSIDGGSTWSLFDAEGDFDPEANVGSVNGQEVAVDISCVAANQSSVIIRFAYNSELDDIYDIYGGSYSVYFWAIDDVCINTNPYPNNLEIMEVVNGDIFNLWEYYATPMEQKIQEADGGLLVGTIINNTGLTDVDNATLTIEVLDESQTNVLSTTVTENVSLIAPTNTSVCPHTYDSVYVETGWVPDNTGIYWIRSTVAVDGVEDATPDNNVMLKKIEYTEDQFGHEDRTEVDFDLRATQNDNNNYDPHGWGNIYSIAYDGSTAYGVNVMFERHTDDNVTAQVRFYQVENSSINESDYEEFYYDIVPAMIPATDGQMVATHLEFDDPIELEADGVYFVAVLVADESSEEIALRAQEFEDTDFSSRTFAVVDGEERWFSMREIPAVRLVLASHPVGIDEVAKPYPFSLSQNSPNPAKDQTTISYNLKQANRVVFEIHDVTGRLIETIDEGKQTQGNHTLTLNLKDYAEGLYQYTMKVNGQKITKQMMVGK